MSDTDARPDDDEGEEEEEEEGTDFARKYGWESGDVQVTLPKKRCEGCASGKPCADCAHGKPKAWRSDRIVPVPNDPFAPWAGGAR